jgi:hypothetical protein
MECDMVEGVKCCKWFFNIHKYGSAEFDLSVECKMDGTELPKLLQQLEAPVADVFFE